MCQSGSAEQPLKWIGASAMKITTVGIDLAKNVFQVHGIDERGKTVLGKQLRRAQVAVFFGNLPPCVIGIEACASAHHWGRTLQRFGHTVRLMAPQFVKPYVKTNKNDVADAEAICEAVGRANMRFVPIKSIEQQAILSMHRVRQGFVKARSAQALGLNCPLDVFEDLFFDHHGDDDFAGVVRFVDWAVVEWEERQLSGVALRRVAVPRPYQHAVDEARWRTVAQGVQDDRSEIVEHWRTAGTWL